MSRTRIHIDREALIDAISRVENGKNPPHTQQEFYEQIATLLTVPIGSVVGRIKDYGLSIKNRKRSAEPTLDLTPFTKRGITINSLGDLFSSSIKDDKTNLAIMAAIVEVRQTAQLPALSLHDFKRLKGE